MINVWTEIAGTEEILAITDEGGGNFRVKVGEKELILRSVRLRNDIIQLFLGRKSYLARVEPKTESAEVHLKGHHYTVAVARGTKRSLSSGPHVAGGVGPQLVTSSIPGKVVDVKVTVGQQVAMGEGLVIVEAMKMENELPAPKAGVIKEIYVKKGQAVEAGEKLVVIE